jgi:hypothetical protein
MNVHPLLVELADHVGGDAERVDADEPRVALVHDPDDSPLAELFEPVTRPVPGERDEKRRLRLRSLLR